jgi:hypothetical protein
MLHSNVNYVGCCIASFSLVHAGEAAQSLRADAYHSCTSHLAPRTILHTHTKATSLWCFRSWTSPHTSDLSNHRAVARPCSSSAPLAPAWAAKLSCFRSSEAPSYSRPWPEKPESSPSSHQTPDHRCSVSEQEVLPTLLCFRWNTGPGQAETLVRCKNASDFFPKELEASQKTWVYGETYFGSK